MKIAIDLDGTAWRYREEFNWLIRALKLAGASVGILTAHKDLKDADLTLWTKRGFPSVDFYISKDGYDTSNLTTEQWKLQVCKENNITFLYDDFDSNTIRLIII